MSGRAERTTNQTSLSQLTHRGCCLSLRRKYFTGQHCTHWAVTCRGMLEFLRYLAAGQLTPGEAELAYNLTVIYGLSILCMVVLHRLLSSPSPRASPDKEWTSRLISSRRSVMPKDLTGERVTREEVETLLEAANWAPTHHRSEPWRFVVIEGSEGIMSYLELVETWYSDNKEEIPDQEYDTFLTKLQSVKTVWPEKVSHLILITMVRQTLPNKKLPEWEVCSASRGGALTSHLSSLPSHLSPCTCTGDLGRGLQRPEPPPVRDEQPRPGGLLELPHLVQVTTLRLSQSGFI